MGCTEPIAVAYAAALARKTLGLTPDTVDIAVSANIIKNVKSVVVPHTGGLRGIGAAAAAGSVAGDADRELEVLSDVTEEQAAQISDYLEKTPMSIMPSCSGYIFDIVVKGVENTIHNVGRLARIGMAETDKEIIQIMVSEQNC